ncbi:hypothetical protein VZT92_006906 [Zoarces viviparus]|uniref:IF rod domain-containing protein n=1 Tax=Zoarces viviparus TaxID=48416 RepID=A0AAW1FJ55_ZOAVI
MAAWQLLRASRSRTRAGPGYRAGHHGPAAAVLYSSVLAAEDETPDGSRSFCLSGQKASLQQLNGRLASYLQQVQRLETANQRLERQIQEQQDRKCPRELRRLDGYLSTVSLLQDQIGECLSALAQVKLQLLSAELTVFDLNARCEKERERGGGVEEDLNNMRLLEEVLKVHTLPELQTLLNDKTQQLMELHIQHQQDTQVLLAQGSGGVAVEMQSTGSSHLIQQLDDLRQTTVMLHDNNQNEFWFPTQASMLGSAEVTLDPPAASEVVWAELEELRRTVATLEEELTHLQALNMELEASGPEQTESFLLQLVDLQQRADGLCRDLDSVLQAAAQQAADHQVLLDVKSRLETEIQDYKRLLDGPSRQGFSSLYSTSNVRSFCGTSSPSAFGRNITENKTVSFQGGNIRMMRVQNVPRGHVCTPSSSHGGFECGGPGSRSIIADKEEELGFGDLYRKGARDEKRLRDRYKNTSGIADNKDVQNLSRSPGGRYGSEDQKETYIMDSEVRGQKNSDQVFVKSASFGSVPANGGTTFGSQSGGSGMVSDLAASCGGTAANSSRAINGNTEAEVRGRFRRGSGDWMVYGGSLGRTSTTSPSTRNEEESPSGATPPGTSRPETGRFGSGGIGEWMVYGGSLRRNRSLDDEIRLQREGKEDGPSVFANSATSPQETGRFSSRGGGEWMVYGGSLGHKNSLPRTGSKERPVAVTLPATNPPDTRRFGSGGSGERMVHSLKRSDSLPIAGSRESQSAAMHLPTSPPETGRFGSRGSGEWTVYGGSTRLVSVVAASDSKESPSVARQLPTSPPGAPRARRYGSGDSGEWRVYGGTSNADGVSISANYGQVVSPPSSYTGSRPRLGSAGSGGSVVRRSSSVGSGGRLRSSGSGSKLSSSPGGHMTSSSGSGESKSVYSSASGRRSTVGGAGGRSGAVRSTSNQRAPSPGGWLSSSQIGGSHVSSAGSGSKLNSAGSGRTNSTGGRVISSSDRPIRSTGSGAGGNKERISVCKMAALSISAAGRERSQDRRGQAQWSKQQQQQQQQAAATSPLVQRWLVGSTSAEPDGLDDIMRL